MDMLHYLKKTDQNMGVSKNRGIPKWMAYNGKPYSNGWFGGYPFFWKHPYHPTSTTTPKKSPKNSPIENTPTTSVACRFRRWVGGVLRLERWENEWLFLVPLIGGIGDISSPNWQYIPLIYYALIVLANWGDYAAKPTYFPGTRKLHLRSLIFPWYELGLQSSPRCSHVSARGSRAKSSLAQVKHYSTVDGRNPANQLRLVVNHSLSNYLQGFIPPRWLALDFWTINCTHS